VRLTRSAVLPAEFGAAALWLREFTARECVNASAACQNGNELFRPQQDWCKTSASADIYWIIWLPKFAATFFNGASRFMRGAELKAFEVPRRHAAEQRSSLPSLTD
jgi:hypothetical protein